MNELETLITELDNKQQTRARENNGEVEIATTPDNDKVYEHEDEIRLQWPMDVEDEFNDVADVEDMEDMARLKITGLKNAGLRNANLALLRQSCEYPMATFTDELYKIKNKLT